MTRQLAAFLLALGAVGALGACTSGSGAPSSPSATPVDTALAPVVTPSAVTPEPTTVTPTPSATPTTAASTAASSSAAATPPQFTTTCTALTVRVLKGGAVRGAEIAAVQFVNDGSSSCTITGTPTATLRRNGAPIGTASTPSATTARAFTIAPGETGESLLRDFSDCEAPLSDRLRVTGPSLRGAPGKVFTEPITLRACTLRMAPVGPPA